MGALSIAAPWAEQPSLLGDFRAYLERSLRDPFTINLKDCSLMEVIRICISTKSKLHPNYEANMSSLVYNLRLLEEQFHVTLQPVQVTDVFWGYFISFCQNRGMKSSSITTLVDQLRAVLNWSVKYNAVVSPTYRDVRPPKRNNQEIALTQDEISRVTYFDIDLFYAGRRKDFRETMHRVRDHFVLSCNLFQRYSDMVRVDPLCFNNNVFSIIQQKTGTRAVVDINRFSVDARTTYRILEKYDYHAPFTGTIGNYNKALHELFRDIGFNDPVRQEERVNGKLVVNTFPKWKMVSSHTSRRSAITIGVLRGHNIHDLKRCSGHSDLRVFDGYIRDE